MEKSILERIRAVSDRLTAKERKAAQALLSNYPMAGLETVAGFARIAGVSGPSILRFTNRIGFNSYPEFQQHLRAEMEARLKSPIAKAPQGPGLGNGGGSDLERFAEAAITNIRDTTHSLAPQELEKAATLIGEASGTVYLVGGRFTDPLARYMAAHLKLLRPRIMHLAGQVDSWRDHLIDMGRKDVLITYDIRRYQEGVIWFAEQAASRKVPIVLFTDQWISPVTRIATHVLPAHIEAPSNFDSSIAILTLTEAVIAQCTKLIWEQAQKRIRDLEELREL